MNPPQVYMGCLSLNRNTHTTKFYIDWLTQMWPKAYWNLTCVYSPRSDGSDSQIQCLQWLYRRMILCVWDHRVAACLQSMALPLNIILLRYISVAMPIRGWALLLLSSIPSCRHSLVSWWSIWIVSSFWQLWINLLGTFMYKCLCGLVFLLAFQVFS